MMGVVPAAPVAAVAAIEAAWAWYDPDAFMALWKDADLDRQVALLNNYWQQLHRSALASGLTMASDSVRKLDQDMAAWSSWKEGYEQAVFRRAIPFGSSGWADQLNDYWFSLFHEDVARIAAEAGDALRRELEDRGVDPRRVEPELSVVDNLIEVSQRAASATAKASRSALFWPLAAIGVFALGSIWVIARAARS